jgi:preprotein translocase subunit SecB
MDKNKQPGISFEAVLLKELVFSRKEGFSQKPEFEMELVSSVSLSGSEDKMNLELSCNISDKNEFFNIKCTMIGIFSVTSENKNMELKEFAEYNAPALIFPYIRETIASTTTRAGIPPVVIPPINLTAIKGKTTGELKEEP